MKDTGGWICVLVCFMFVAPESKYITSNLNGSATTPTLLKNKSNVVASIHSSSLWVEDAEIITNSSETITTTQSTLIFESNKNGKSNFLMNHKFRSLINLQYNN